MRDGPGLDDRGTGPAHRARWVPSRAGNITAVYAVVATLWIYLSDQALNVLVGDPAALVRWSVLKGVGFVGVTSLLLFFLMRRAFGAVEAGFERLRAEEAHRLGVEAERREALEVARSEKLFSDVMIESMPGILYLYTEEGTFLRWNKNFERVSGCSPRELVDAHPLQFFSADHREMVAERIAEVFEKGEAFVEAPFLSKDGRSTPYFMTGRRLRFDGRDCLVGVGIDISSRVRAENELRATAERFRATLDNILEGCQLIDFNWRYLYLNAAAAAQNRRPNEELLHRTMQEGWPGIEDTELFTLLERCMLDRVPVYEEIAFTFPDGASGWFDLRCEPVPEGIFILSIDVSERRRAENELHLLNRTLEAKVVDRTRALESALVRAEAADRVKSAFLATMSHELRTPLNSIIGFTGMILQELAGPVTAEQRKQLGMVKRSAHHLLDLINDVLDLSKIEAGQLDVRMEPVVLGELLEEVTEAVRPQAEARGIELRLQIAPDLGTIRSDRRRVRQVVLNLLSNGIKFTERGSVTLLAHRDGAQVNIRVEDTGVGIGPGDLDLLFQPFRQLDTGLTRRHEGTGLGLAICRRLATLMGGEISVASQRGQGSEFSLTLPTQGRG